MAKPKKSAKKSEPKPEEAPAGIGHNLTEVKKKAGTFLKRYNKILDEKEETLGEFTAQVTDLIEEGANAIGCKKKVLRIALSEDRAAAKREARDKELESTDSEALDMLRAALGELGAAAADKIEKGGTA